MIARALGSPPDHVKHIAFCNGREARSAMTAEQIGFAGRGELAGEFRAWVGTVRAGPSLAHGA